MPETTFTEDTIEYLLDTFELEADTEGYVTIDDDRLTDGYGEPIHQDDIGGIIHFGAYDLDVNDDGIVVGDVLLRVNA